jgi:dTDP-4-dehydrorhamnose 3,5-epimerase
MKVSPSPLPGVLLIEPKVWPDERGFFCETYQEKRYLEAGISDRFVQDNLSCSSKHTLRGLHAQVRRPQAKLVRCVEGEIWDVAVDMRKGSPHFGKWHGEILSAANARQLYVPVGFLHGFVVLSDSAQVEYKVSDYYQADDQFGVAWNDPDLGIAWPVASPLLSKKDRDAAGLKEQWDQLPQFP